MEMTVERSEEIKEVLIGKGLSVKEFDDFIIAGNWASTEIYLFSIKEDKMTKFPKQIDHCAARMDINAIVRKDNILYIPYCGEYTCYGYSSCATVYKINLEDKTIDFALKHSNICSTRLGDCGIDGLVKAVAKEDLIIFILASKYGTGTNNYGYSRKLIYNYFIVFDIKTNTLYKPAPIERMSLSTAGLPYYHCANSGIDQPEEYKKIGKASWVDDIYDIEYTRKSEDSITVHLTINAVNPKVKIETTKTFYSWE